MSERVPCRACGASVLPATFERTGGFCMPCSKDPSGRSARVPPPPPSPDQTLKELRQKLSATLTETARHAVRELANEEIYGFALFHGQFLYAGATVFTEAGLQAKVKEYESRGHKTTPERLRWSPCDSPHHLYREDSFSEVQSLFIDLECHTDTDFSCEIEQIFLSVLAEVRNVRVLPVGTLLLLVEGDQSNESRFAYAERVNDAECLERYRRELPVLDESHLAHFRAAIPST